MEIRPRLSRHQLLRAGIWSLPVCSLILLSGCRGPGFGTISSYPGYNQPVFLSQSPMMGGPPTMIGAGPGYGCPSCQPRGVPYGQPMPTPYPGPGYRRPTPVPTPYGPRADKPRDTEPLRPGDPGFKDVPTYPDPISPGPGPLPKDPLGGGGKEPPIPPIGSDPDNFGGAKPFTRDKNGGGGSEPFGGGKFTPESPTPFPSTAIPAPKAILVGGAEPAKPVPPPFGKDEFPAPFAPDKSGKLVTARPAAANSFGYDRDNFRWLKGTVDYDARERTWHIIYALVPDSDDPFGGTVTLLGAGLNSLRNGQSVLVRGRIDHTHTDNRGKACFHVDDVMLQRRG